jgi:Flp pilus assembly protein TadG
VRRTLSNQRGAVSVDLAVSSLMFLVALVAVFDFGRMYYYQSRLTYAVTQSARIASADNIIDDAVDSAANLSRADSIVLTIKQLSGFDGLSEADIDVISLGAGGATIAGAGGPGDVVTVTATYRVDVIAPYLSALFDDGAYEFSATTTFRNEELPEATLRTFQADAPPVA